MKTDELYYKLALSMIPGIGGVLARNLLAYTGSARRVFSEPYHSLMKIPGIGEVHARGIKNSEVFIQAEKELKFIDKHKIEVLFFADQNFPRRLKHCPDAPIVLFYKGNASLNEQRVISIVGTRNATSYGKMICEQLIQGLAERNHPVLVVSGLAYGIDVHAHKMAMKHHIPTIGVLGHGLDRIYPALHANVAKEMMQHGGLVADFPSGTKIDPPNFIRRNRIIAGLADATIVVESAEKGGALITADIASSYNRDVFAFPGRIDKTFSRGCNRLIGMQQANLIQGIEDLEYLMGWDPLQHQSAKHPLLFDNLTPEEEKVMNILQSEGELFIDQISSKLEMPGSKVSALLLNLEFKNLICSLPGKVFKLR